MDRSGEPRTRSSALATPVAGHRVDGPAIGGLALVVAAPAWTLGSNAARGPLHAGVTGYPWLLSALGPGGGLCAPVLGRLASGRSPALLVVAGFAVFTAPTAILVFSRSLPLDVGVEALQGAGTMVSDVVGLTALQLALPAEARGRGLGVFFALVAAGPGLGSLLAGGLVGAVGLVRALFALGPALALAAVASLPWLARHTGGSRGAPEMSAPAERTGPQAPGCQGRAWSSA